MKREGSAKWAGTLQHGRGWLTTNSGALDEVPYTFASRFEDEPQTNPEELIAAAHAGCFSMALSASLGKENFEPKSIETTAKVSLEKVDGNWTIASSRLEVEAIVPGIDEAKFQALADDAKKNCPVSRLLKAEISMEAKLKPDSRTARTHAPSQSGQATP